MSSLPASIKMIQSITAEKKWQHCFSNYRSIGIFSVAKGQLTPQSAVDNRRGVMTLSNYNFQHEMSYKGPKWYFLC